MGFGFEGWRSILGWFLGGFVRHVWKKCEREGERL